MRIFLSLLLAVISTSCAHQSFREPASRTSLISQFSSFTEEFSSAFGDSQCVADVSKRKQLSLVNRNLEVAVTAFDAALQSGFENEGQLASKLRKNLESEVAFPMGEISKISCNDFRNISTSLKDIKCSISRKYVSGAKNSGPTIYLEVNTDGSRLEIAMIDQSFYDIRPARETGIKMQYVSETRQRLKQESSVVGININFVSAEDSVDGNLYIASGKKNEPLITNTSLWFSEKTSLKTPSYCSLP